MSRYQDIATLCCSLYSSFIQGISGNVSVSYLLLIHAAISFVNSYKSPEHANDPFYNIEDAIP
jgi:hypothetical protein